MIVNNGRDCTIEKVNKFNKLMITTIKAKKDRFEFEDKNYMVYSDGVCVQTLINGSFLYRIFIENQEGNRVVSSKLSLYL